MTAVHLEAKFCLAEKMVMNTYPEMDQLLSNKSLVPVNTMRATSSDSTALHISGIDVTDIIGWD
jgi:hypothetical protein